MFRIFNKTFAALLFGILAIIQIHAANPSRFPINPAGVWKVYTTNDEYSPGVAGSEEYIKYYIDSDTTINSQTYYKVYKSGLAYYDGPFTYKHIYVGAIRDEENRFYYIVKNNTIEHLLFDFNVKMDDTIKSGIGKNHVINYVDSLNDGRKLLGSLPFICAGCCPAPVLIEGIGHTDGLFEDPSCNHPGFQKNILVCYSEGDNIIYQSESSIVSCSSFTETNPVKRIDRTLNVYPIPATNNITIETNKNTDSPYFVSIYNICGIMVYSQNIEHYTGKIEIDVQHLKRGNYLVRLTTKDQIQSSFIILE